MFCPPSDLFGRPPNRWRRAFPVSAQFPASSNSVVLVSMRQTVSQEPLDREKPLQLETVFVDYRILALIDWDATVTAFSSSKRPLMRHGLLLVFSLFLSADPASPQAPPMTEAPHEAETGAPAWTWTTDA